MATEGQVVGALIQKTARLKGQARKVGKVFGTKLAPNEAASKTVAEMIKDYKANPLKLKIEMIKGYKPDPLKLKTERAVVLKGKIVEAFVAPDRVVTADNARHHIKTIYGALSEMKREARVTMAQAATNPDKNAEQRTIEWLGSETDRLRALLGERTEKDRDYQRSIKAAVKALREGL